LNRLTLDLCACLRTIGVLSPGPRLLEQTFFDALSELGWVEGKNVAFEARYADNRLERLPVLAEELVRLNVDLIVGIGTLAPLAAKRATSTIPIVMGAAGDPVGSGLVASLARPGGNVTGMSLMAPDLGGKRLELLKELLPRLVRVAVLWNAANPYPAIVFKETHAAGRTLGVEVQSLEVRSPDDFDGAFETARRQRPDALITVEYQNSQTLTHAAGALPGHPLQKRTEVQWDIGAAVDADDGADESTSPQPGISRRPQ
jgi:putative tryptophan/tyrosine transport system substrate-binding protein